ncbi:hypothetical protein [Streptomyces noursei]|uniref:hypothetical protein n=1 Tax=Streptomyces noursei TaxID=1971 RepID=UPI0030F36BAD
MTHRPQDATVRQVRLRAGGTVTVMLLPSPDRPWPQPRSSSPMVATIMSAVTESDGTARITIRGARTGVATVSWGDSFTLRLDVAAYQVQ